MVEEILNLHLLIFRRIKNHLAQTYMHPLLYKLCDIMIYKNLKKSLGHYTAFVRSISNQQWFHTDDTQVNQITTEVQLNLKEIHSDYTSEYCNRDARGCMYDEGTLRPFQNM